MNLYATAQHVMEALTNGALQGLVVFALVAAALRLLPTMNAATRHAVWFVSLLLMAALPVVHGFRVSEFFRAVPTPAPAPGPVAALVPTDTQFPASAESRLPFPHRIPGGEVPLPDGRAWVIAEGDDPLVPWIESGASPDAAESGQQVTGSSPKPQSVDRRLTGFADEEPAGLSHGASESAARWGIPVSQGVAVVLVLGWIIPAAFRLTRLMVEVGRVRQLKRGSKPAPEEVCRCFEHLRTVMGVRRPVVVRIGPADTVPFVAGFLHPIVVLPEGHGMPQSIGDVTQVLRHELAHVRRHDDWTHLIEQGLRAVLWFHPAVHWIVRRLSLEREIACDDHVLDAAHSSRNYALLLTGFAGRRPGRDLHAAPAVWSRKTQLKERIAMILDTKRNASPRIARAMAGLLILGTTGITGLVLRAGPQLDLIAPPSADSDATAAFPVNVEAAINVNPDALPEPVAPVLDGKEGVTRPRIKTGVAGEVPEPPTPPEPTLAPPPVPPIPALPALEPLPAPRPVRAAANVNVHVDPAADVRTDASKAVRVNVRRIEGKDRGSLEERLDRLERMMEQLMAWEGAGWQANDGSPDRVEFRVEQDPTAGARGIARKAVLEARSHLPDAEMVARINKEVAAAAREGERAAREAVREAQKAMREQQRAMELSKGRSTAAVGDFREQLERQRMELEAQRQKLRHEMESLERRLETLESDGALLEALKSSRKEEVRDRKRPAAASDASPVNP
ncbi:MAG: hypothetical protein KF791_20620 [Verrucomicrobiae bacterium]|nr:hypothetical protein [Verrucomicrobiae bacterium]